MIDATAYDCSGCMVDWAGFREDFFLEMVACCTAAEYPVTSGLTDVYGFYVFEGAALRDLCSEMSRLEMRLPENMQGCLDVARRLGACARSALDVGGVV
jgi:hypothetical protein